MGREIRKVPPHWDHPKQYGYSDGRLQPMHDTNFDDAAREWKEGLAAWERGERPEWCTGDSRNQQYWEYEGDPPDRAYCRPWRDEEATWVQAWETVSEGTPVTPPFATADELIVYLVKHGDYWDQKRGNGGWDEKAAREFVGEGFALSLLVMGGKFYEPRDGMPPRGDAG